MSTPAIRARFIGSATVAVGDIVVSAGDPIQALCRKLVAAGHDPQSSLTIWRGARPWRWVERIAQPHQVRVQHRSKA